MHSTSTSIRSHAGHATAGDIYRSTVLQPLFAAAKAHAGHYDRIDLAQALMLTEQGVIAAVDGQRLLHALARLPNALALGSRTDAGAFEDLFFLREAALREHVGADLAGRLHTGRSRNDIEATIFRLQTRERLMCLIEHAGAVTKALIEKAERERATLILAYTHGQPAQPSTWGHYLLAFTEVLLRDLRRLCAALEDVDACPLGAAAITTTGFPIDRERLAALLGFARVQDNSYGCIAGADQFAAVQGAMHLMFINIGRLVQDLAFWTSFELGQAWAADGFVQVSSIMPQKRNPLAIEHMRVMASLGMGHCLTALGALHNTPFADMVDAEGPTQSAGLASFDMATRLLTLLDAFMQALRIDPVRVRRAIDASCATVTELADSLVRLEGIAFRTAHEIAAELSRMLVDQRRGMGDLRGEEVAQAFQAHVGHPPASELERLQKLCTPEHFVAVRDRTGGPAPRSISASLAQQAGLVEQVLSSLAQVRGRQAQAHRMLDEAVAARCLS